MKTNLDLLRELTRWLFTQEGRSPSEVEMEMQLCEDEWAVRGDEPIPMSDEEYSSRLEEMKPECTNYLGYLVCIRRLPKQRRKVARSRGTSGGNSPAATPPTRDKS